ncbi:MAG: XRE family transcriptional regulator [Aggregatilineales bacterium]
MRNKEPVDTSAEEQDYLDWRDELLSDPETTALYDEEAAKKELWLQLVEARQEAGLTQVQMGERLGVSQSQVARMEKRGYDTYTLTTLRRYVAALGEGYSLEVNVHTPSK